MSGLEGVVAAETKLSMVDGEKGELIIAGYPVEELAPNATFEQTVSLLWYGVRRVSAAFKAAALPPHSEKSLLDTSLSPF